MDFKLINVGIAEIGVASAPDMLRTILGSCVSVCLYDPEAKVGGMSHIMLPEKKQDSPALKKYADTAIPLLISEMEKQNAERKNITAKIIGGAKMFDVVENSIMGEIGRKNIKRVREILIDFEIPVVSEDTGGDYGRTVDFHLETGEVRVRTMGKEEKVI